jgi:hypothetical protein
VEGLAGVVGRWDAVGEHSVRRSAHLMPVFPYPQDAL